MTEEKKTTFDHIKESWTAVSKPTDKIQQPLVTFADTFYNRLFEINPGKFF